MLNFPPWLSSCFVSRLRCEKNVPKGCYFLTNKWFVWTLRNEKSPYFLWDESHNNMISHLCWLILATINGKKAHGSRFGMYEGQLWNWRWLLSQESNGAGFSWRYLKQLHFQSIRQSCVPALLTEVRGTFSGTDAVSSILVALFLFGKVSKNEIMPWLQPQVMFPSSPGGGCYDAKLLNKRTRTPTLWGLRKHRFLRENFNFCGRDYSCN